MRRGLVGRLPLAGAALGCGRPGGDEFAILSRSATDEAGATAMARRVADAMAGAFVVGDRPMNGSAGIGVAAPA